MSSCETPSKIWGKYTLDTEKAIKEELGTDKVEIAEIGPAGEQLVRYACILSSASRATAETAWVP